MKTCSKCGEPQPRHAFPVSRKAKDGLHSWCKRCFAAWREPRRAELSARQRQRMDGFRHHWATHDPYDDSSFKRCRVCKRSLPRRDFARNQTMRDGLVALCRVCHGWQERTRKYRLSREQLEALLTRQGGVCAVCGTSTTFGGKGGAHIDHDHSCCSNGDGPRRACGNCVRGVLCMHCNRLLGSLERSVGDYEAWIRAANRYIVGAVSVTPRQTTAAGSSSARVQRSAP